jgi:hypothetical protein
MAGNDRPQASGGGSDRVAAFESHALTELIFHLPFDAFDTFFERTHGRVRDAGLRDEGGKDDELERR